MINVAVLVIVLCIGLAVVARLDFRERWSAGCGGSELPVCGGDGRVFGGCSIALDSQPNNLSPVEGCLSQRSGIGGAAVRRPFRCGWRHQKVLECGLFGSGVHRREWQSAGEGLCATHRTVRRVG